jgi:hypothetical protein
MSVNKLVDSTQLDADLTSVANAIRTKGGTSASLAFPAEFVSAIQAIPSGGGGEWTSEGIAKGTEPSGAITLSATVISAGAFCGRPITSIYAPNVTSLASMYAFRGCPQLTKAKFPNVTSLGNPNLFQFQESKVQYVAIPKLTGDLTANFLQSCRSLLVVDAGKTPSIQTRATAGSTNFNTLILRRTTAITALVNVAGIASDTKFKNGGAGGTIYIPEVLYNHLGDGTSLDYKAATNWSTVNGYGTITWAKLEGSPYESEDWLQI